MRLIGGKWKGSILWHLKDGPVRFNDLARQLGGASKKVVNQRLKEMEALGLLERKVLLISLALYLTAHAKAVKPRRIQQLDAHEPSPMSSLLKVFRF